MTCRRNTGSRSRYDRECRQLRRWRRPTVEAKRRDGADTERARGALRPKRHETNNSELEYNRRPPGGTVESADSGRETPARLDRRLCYGRSRQIAGGSAPSAHPTHPLRSGRVGRIADGRRPTLR